MLFRSYMESDNTGDVDLQARACLRGRSMRRWINSPDRLTKPMKRVGKRGEGKFEEISWDEAIDAVLNQKGYAAQKQHIDIQFEVNDLSPLQIELIDCTVVLGNLLDNAIEACLKLEEAKRRIEVSVLRDEAYADGDAKLYVSIINTSLPVHIEKDCIATTKLEPHLHGFGLPCAKELLRRNNAFYTMDYHDGAFQFCFEWPDVACNSCVHA